MEVQVFSDYDEMCGAVAQFILGRIRQKPASLICLPSGDTPTGILDLLVKASMEGRADFSRCQFIGLDEWAGLDGNDEGSCRNYLDVRFFLPLKVATERIHFFNGTAPDLQAECERIKVFLERSGPIDVAMVGVGMNGHVGLNEPGTDINQYAHVFDLQDQTRVVARKYFREMVPLSQGITLGPRNLLESRTLIMVASGMAKAPVIARALESPVTPECPAGLIRLHADGHVFLDRDAASGLAVT